MNQAADYETSFANSERLRQPVTVSAPDGKSHEGMVTGVVGQVMFIESKSMMPVGREVGIHHVRTEDSTRKPVFGIVAWQCVSEDEFGNQAGFAVCLQGHWSETSEGRLKRESKEGT